MSSFDPSQPAILHDRISDATVTWTGEEAAEFRRTSRKQDDGTVLWRDMRLDGWGEVLGG